MLDFGLARQRSNVSELSNASLPAGTLRYMPAEQTRGEAATSASDVFSFGLFLMKLLLTAGMSPGYTAMRRAACNERFSCWFSRLVGGWPNGLLRLGPFRSRTDLEAGCVRRDAGSGHGNCCPVAA